MPTFRYSARDREGRLTTGTLDAASLPDLRRVLRGRELFLTEVQAVAAPRAAGAARPARGRRIALGDLVVMSRQLATLVRAGIPIVECLHVLATQTENPALVRVINAVRLDVLGGDTLSGAMARHPRAFNETTIALVQAGEAAGVLEETLETAALQYDREAELREKVRSAFIYPAVVLVVAAVVVLFMLFVIVPVFANVYVQFRAQLPLVTRVLVSTSFVMLRYGWVALLAGLVAAAVAVRWVRTPRGRMAYDRLRLRLPILGKLNRKIAVARFTQTLAAVTRAGVPILRALAVSAGTCGNRVIEEAALKVAEHVKEGATIAVPLEQTGEFPPMVTRMIAAGEQAGELDHMLAEVNRFYQRDIEYTVGRITRLIEPLMTVIVGGVVLFVLLALYLPVFNLARVIR